MNRFLSCVVLTLTSLVAISPCADAQMRMRVPMHPTRSIPSKPNPVHPHKLQHNPYHHTYHNPYHHPHHNPYHHPHYNQHHNPYHHMHDNPYHHHHNPYHHHHSLHHHHRDPYHYPHYHPYANPNAYATSLDQGSPSASSADSSEPGTASGNVLSGAADLARANADATLKLEQVSMVREQVNQTKLDTRKMAFDLMLYEKANTPTYTETLTQERLQLLTRLLNYPTPSEIANGTTLNILLPHLQALTVYGRQGTPILIPQGYLDALNVTDGELSSSIGMLRNGGLVEWPVSLRGLQQSNLDRLLPFACDAIATGNLDARLMQQIRTEMKTMRARLRQQLARDAIATSSYQQAIEFYNALENGVNALERPGARKQLDGSCSARGRTIQELVVHMSENGLKFAPASPGSENAYQLVHDGFVRYARMAQSRVDIQASRATTASLKQ